MKELTTKALALAPVSAEILNQWGKYAGRKASNVAQQKNIWQNAKAQKDIYQTKKALNAAASLTFCNKRVIVEQKGGEFIHRGAWYCGKKYCAYCANRKRRKILNRFTDFFGSEKGREILENYDLGLFTVTLQHNKHNKRTEPYYQELSKHWRNALKYGAFKKFIKGGFYNTEHTYGKNGHHIHRHALVMIPRQFNLTDNFRLITEELRTQWSQRTGGSFQIDLRPLGYNELTESAPTRAQYVNNIGIHMLEVTKYITKRDNTGIIHYEIIKAIENNSRAKFYGRFGILHRIKELNLNLEIVETEPAASKEPRKLFIGTPVIKQNKKLVRHELPNKGKEVTKHNGREHIRVINLPQTNKKNIVTYTDKSAISYQIKDLVPIEDNKEAMKEFQEHIRDAVYQWKLEKWSKLIGGYTVIKWKENRMKKAKFEAKYGTIAAN